LGTPSYAVAERQNGSFVLGSRMSVETSRIAMLCASPRKSNLSRDATSTSTRGSALRLAEARTNA